MNRRELFRIGAGTLAAPLAGIVGRARAAGMRFNYSICNEMFEKRDFAATCKAIRGAGFAGVEISPFTLAENVDQISPARRRELAGIIHSEGLRFAGLHWLLVTPAGLHVTTADKKVRDKSWEYVRKVVDLCADLGKGIMVFGSPKQRGAQNNTVAEATENFKTGLASIAPHAGERGCTVLIEALSSKETNVVNTLGEAVRLVREINHPAIQTMFDFHNTADEKEPAETLVRKYFRYIRHIHVNEMDGRYPGSGSFNFLPAFQALLDLKYSRWVSLEVFDFKPSPDQILRETMAFYQGLEKRLGPRP